MSQGVYIGVDVGTTAIKAAAFDASGQLLTLNSVPSNVTEDAPGHASQDMDMVWDATASAIRAVCDSIAPQTVLSVGVCGQGDGLWMLDEAFRPVREAILWNDQRAADQVLQWTESGVHDAIVDNCGTDIWPGTSGAAFRWLKENEPQSIERARYILNCKDWINFKLTGALSTDFSDATIPFLDLTTRRYATDLFDQMDVAEASNCVLDPRPATERTGTVGSGAAQATGLAEGTPVATGCIDVASMMIGAGLTQVGDFCMILGTTGVVAANVEPNEKDMPKLGATMVHPYSDSWIRILAPLSGASAFDWFVGISSDGSDTETPDAKLQRIIELATVSPPGANDVLFLPFLTGERAPFVAPQATASFLGMRSVTTQSDLARAVMEGTAFSLRHCAQSIRPDTPAQIMLMGGGAKNSLWCDIIASVVQTTITVTDESDHGLWGAALLGAHCAGLVDVKDLPQREVPLRYHHPEADLVETYDRVYQRYVDAVAVAPKLWT